MTRKQITLTGVSTAQQVLAALGKLTIAELARTLKKVGMGLVQDSAALRQASRLPNLYPAEQAALKAYLAGNASPSDGLVLQVLSVRLTTEAGFNSDQPATASPVRSRESQICRMRRIKKAISEAKFQGDVDTFVTVLSSMTLVELLSFMDDENISVDHREFCELEEIRAMLAQYFDAKYALQLSVA